MCHCCWVKIQFDLYWHCTSWDCPRTNVKADRWFFSYNSHTHRFSHYILIGPMKKQMGDYGVFWAMVWQQKVEKIVKVTKLKEEGVRKGRRHILHSSSLHKQCKRHMLNYKRKGKLSKAKQAVISSQYNYKDRSVFFLLSNLVKKRWIPSGMSGRQGLIWVWITRKRP